MARFGDYFATAWRALVVLAQQVRCSVVDGPTGSQAARVATTHVLGVAAQLVSALSVSDAAAAVPPALAVALGDTACDEALATTTPFLRETLRPYLASLDAAAAVDLAATDATTAAAVQVWRRKAPYNLLPGGGWRLCMWRGGGSVDCFRLWLRLWTWVGLAC